MRLSFVVEHIKYHSQEKKSFYFFMLYLLKFNCFLDTKWQMKNVTILANPGV